MSSFPAPFFFKSTTARRFSHRKGIIGFSLVELLVVISIIVMLAVGVVPAIDGIRGGQNLSKAAYDVAGVLEQARTYAMAKNTYAYVGIAEAQEGSSPIQLAPGGGRLVVAVMASRSGIRPASMSGGELAPMGRLLSFDNIKLDALDLEGNMAARKTGIDVVNMAEEASSGFSGLVWKIGGANITFDKVIEFDSAGVARFISRDAIDGWIEIPLKPLRGGDKNVAALQVDGVTGAVRVYRP